MEITKQCYMCGWTYTLKDVPWIHAESATRLLENKFKKHQNCDKKKEETNE